MIAKSDRFSRNWWPAINPKPALVMEQRTYPPRPCSVCGTVFTPLSLNSSYCRNRCRLQAAADRSKRNREKVRA
jgi:predicted nucleic acid-binding Zn ribbon protein